MNSAPEKKKGRPMGRSGYAEIPDEKNVLENNS